MGIGRFAFTPILPMMQDDAGLSIARGSWLASANYVGYFLGALWATVHRVRSPLAIRAALLVIGLATLAMGLVEQFAAWLVLRMLAGVLRPTLGDALVNGIRVARDPEGIRDAIARLLRP